MFAKLFICFLFMRLFIFMRIFSTCFAIECAVCFYYNHSSPHRHIADVVPATVNISTDATYMFLYTTHTHRYTYLRVCVCVPTFIH